jgi:hypothetical protein
MSNKRSLKKPPRYVERALRTFPDMLKPGSVNVLEVKHDAWCPKLQDHRLPCHCTPDIELHTQPKANN